MQNKVTELLDLTYNIIEDKKNWTTRSNARDENHDEIEATEPEAVCFCTWGALERAENILKPKQTIYQQTRDLITQEILKFIDFNIESPYPTDMPHNNSYHVITEFNDHRTTSHKNVLKVITQSIQAAQKTEKENNVSTN